MEAQFRFKRDCRTFTKLEFFSKQFQFLERLCFKEKPKIMSFCSISLSDLATCSFKFISLGIYTCRRKRELIILYIKRPGKTCGHILKETEYCNIIIICSKTNKKPSYILYRTQFIGCCILFFIFHVPKLSTSLMV